LSLLAGDPYLKRCGFEEVAVARQRVVEIFLGEGVVSFVMSWHQGKRTTSPGFSGNDCRSLIGGKVSVLSRNKRWVIRRKTTRIDEEDDPLNFPKKELYKKGVVLESGNRRPRPFRGVRRWANVLTKGGKGKERMALQIGRREYGNSLS